MAATTNIEDELRHARNTKPFAPFTVVTTHGERYVVAKKLWCAFTSDRLIIWLAGIGSKRFLLDDVAAIERSPGNLPERM
jgi:hypothetical protein